MSEELALINGIGKAVNGFIQVWRERGEFNQLQKVRIEETVTLYRTQLRNKGIGILGNENLSIVMGMLQRINEANLSGLGLEMAMEQLTTVHEGLTKNLKGYSDGF